MRSRIVDGVQGSGCKVVQLLQASGCPEVSIVDDMVFEELSHEDVEYEKGRRTTTKEDN